MPTPDVNWSLLRDKISDINDALEILSKYARRETAELLDDEEALRSAKYTFVVLAEAATNIATHICIEALDEAPASYADSFLILAENDLLDPHVCEKMAQLAGFRNLLVHRYAQVNDKHMLEMMREDLPSVEEFIACLANLC